MLFTPFHMIITLAAGNVIQGIPFFGDIPFHYWTDPITLFFTMIVAMSFAEHRRIQVGQVTGTDWYCPVC